MQKVLKIENNIRTEINGNFFSF